MLILLLLLSVVIDYLARPSITEIRRDIMHAETLEQSCTLVAKSLRGYGSSNFEKGTCTISDYEGQYSLTLPASGVYALMGVIAAGQK
jgi:hypothetical protein